MNEWYEIHNGMVGHWKHYAFFRDVGSNVQPHERLYEFPRVFLPIGAGECPHFSWSIDYIDQDNFGPKPFSEWRPPDATPDNPKQYGVTLHVSCDDCGQYGSLNITFSNKALKETYHYIDWDDVRMAMSVTFKDIGYKEWREKQDGRTD